MKNKDQMIANICNSVLEVSNNRYLYKYCLRLIKANYNYIININDSLVTADRHGEKLDISVDINNNVIKIYTTEWGQTDKNIVLYHQDKDGYIFIYKNNDIEIIDGLISNNYKSVFNKDGILVYTSKEEKYNVDFTLKHERRRRNKSKSVEIYILDNEIALKKVMLNGKVRFYLIESIPNLFLEDNNIFEKIDNRPASEIDEETFENIKSNKGDQKILKLG